MKRVVIIVSSVVLLSWWATIYLIGSGYIDVTWTSKKGLQINEGLSHACRTMSRIEFERLYILRGVKVEED